MDPVVAHYSNWARETLGGAICAANPELNYQAAMASLNDEMEQMCGRFFGNRRVLPFDPAQRSFFVECTIRRSAEILHLFEPQPPQPAPRRRSWINRFIPRISIRWGE